MGLGQAYLDDIEDNVFTGSDAITLFPVEGPQKTSQTIHDHQQFQSDFDYDLSVNSPLEKRKCFTVDSYFFLPDSMGINRHNFTREQFYTSLTHYMRIRSPLPEHEMPSLGLGFLANAERYFQVHLLSHLRKPLEPLVVQDVKLFGCYVNSHFKTLKSTCHELVAQKRTKDSERTETFKAFLLETLHILGDYRKNYMGRVRYGDFLLDAEVKRAFLLVDEYLSYRLETVFLSMQQRLDEAVGAQELWELMNATLQSEMEYRQSEGLIYLDEEATESLRETFFYRQRMLKKYVSEVLYLKIHNVRKDKAYRNLVAAAGAALAALWAGLIDLHRFYYLSKINEATTGASDFAIRFFMIVVVGVVAYIFKDRIKELTREYFFQRLKQFLPDYEFEMQYPRRELKEDASDFYKVGKSTQYMRFINKEALPPEVLYTRELGHRQTLDPKTMEEVLHYSHSIQLDSQVVAGQSELLHGIKNISRFSVAPFLEKLDEPNKNLRFFDPKRGVSMIRTPKVYHLNVVFRYTSNTLDIHGNSSREVVNIERIRLILDKEGIQRIEPVVERGEIQYQVGASV